MEYRRNGKRALDVLLAAAGLALFAFPMLWFALVLRREAGPGVPRWTKYGVVQRGVLFRQRRVGYQGKPFTIIKFRTMTDKGRSGPFSRWLRRTALDELPQLVHILRGEMSFVGPRPLIPEELAELRAFPGGDRRFSVRPGLTGLAQTQAPKAPHLQERLRWDLAYVDRCSLGLDLKILLKSVGITLRGAWEQIGQR